MPNPKQCPNINKCSCDSRHAECFACLSPSTSRRMWFVFIFCCLLPSASSPPLSLCVFLAARCTVFCRRRFGFDCLWAKNRCTKKTIFDDMIALGFLLFGWCRCCCWSRRISYTPKTIQMQEHKFHANTSWPDKQTFESRSVEPLVVRNGRWCLSHTNYGCCGIGTIYLFRHQIQYTKRTNSLRFGIAHHSNQCGDVSVKKNQSVRDGGVRAVSTDHSPNESICLEPRATSMRCRN